MRILIIGSKGFIGSHAVKYFRNEGYNCYGCDVVVDYSDKKYFQIDTTTDSFQAIFRQQKFDACVNCSGAASVPDSYTHSLRDFKLNTFNVYHILSTIKEFQSECLFINLSSAAVYGDPKKLPVGEGMELSPVSPYGWNKKQAEEICKNFSTFFGLKTCSLRIFSAFGEGLKKQLFWDVAMKTKNKNKKELELFGTGEEVRDFIYVKDLVAVIDLVLKSTKFKGECINVASGSGTLIKSAVQLLLDHLHYTGRIMFNHTERQGDPSKWIADISILKSFGYTPRCTLNDGLKNYALWLRENALV